MTLTKQNQYEELRKTRPSINHSLDERLIDMLTKKNIQVIELGVDENGHATVNKDEHPDIYDWLVNG
jgi:Mrp family chromosome partitioning ATPase